MAAPRRKPDPAEPDLSSLPDFQLLNSVTTLVSKEHSQLLTAVVWEILRRYTTWLVEQPQAKPRDYSAILGEARWGDAKRVEVIFGIRRGVLTRLREEGTIKSKLLDDDGGDAHSVRKAKRLYDLASILEYLESAEDPPSQGDGLNRSN